MKQTIRSLFALVSLIWIVARWTREYIDPNTGGMLFQLLAIVLAFASAIILFFSRQIRQAFARLSRLVREFFPR